MQKASLAVHVAREVVALTLAIFKFCVFSRRVLDKCKYNGSAYLNVPNWLAPSGCPYLAAGHSECPYLRECTRQAVTLVLQDDGFTGGRSEWPGMPSCASAHEA